MSLAEIEGFGEVLRESPKDLLNELQKAYRGIGSTDIDKVRQNINGKFTIRSKGLSKSFKFKATDTGQATDFSKLFVNEYTGWKAAQIFQTGGTISGKGKMLTVLTDAARSLSGKRKYTQAQLRQMVAAGKARFIPTPRGTLLVMDKGGLTKTGKQRKGSATIILAILRKQITEAKRLDFYENFEANSGVHQDLLETAVENALVNIASK